MRFSWRWPFLRFNPPETLTSDFGRRYGWFAEKDGEVVARLDYICWDEYMQFWHDYQLNILKPEMECLALDSNAWKQHSIVLRNVKFTDVTAVDYIPSVKADHTISMRGLYVPDECIRYRNVYGY